MPAEHWHKIKHHYLSDNPAAQPLATEKNTTPRALTYTC